MKIACQRLTFGLLFHLAIIFQLSAQSTHTTNIILLRHAEKDTTVSGLAMMKADPPLSKAGQKRAETLLTALKDFQPDKIYSTHFNRTQATVAPLAKKFGLGITFYDTKNQLALAEQLKKELGKTIVVVGHSNSIPALVNAITGTSNYPDLADNEYNKIWIITIQEGKITERQIRY